MASEEDTITDHVVLWIPKLVYLLIAFLSVIFLLMMLVKINIDSSEAEGRIFINRIVYSPNAISYFDGDIIRAYPGVIDMQKFKKLQNRDLNELDTNALTYGQGNRLIAAKLVLINLIDNTEDAVYYNKENYDFWEPRILSTATGGSGSVKPVNEQRYILVKDGDKIYNGILKINVIVRK